ncbi:tyrosine-type recombinase/integrase [Pectobacterium brasiliense]|uniref:tyrosine-type recombinase/integrase n=1 Tax=Pectobacterium brasiliense TaxID=180957 RepID=UPI001CF126E6|nr:site-specific integrase [Pectobacterium brasiliense]MCA6984749.1 site-specific integrase [Pectobacterium brasiliense]MCH4994282.1 site-specific integrase [Pectobacterium brasiliense]
MATIAQDRQVAALSATKEENEKLVSVKSKAGGGLYIRVRCGSDSKSWIYRYRIAQKQAKLTLGAYPAMTLAQARDAHSEAVAWVKKGIDPRHVKKHEKQQNEQMLTFAELWKDWLTFRAETKPLGDRTKADYEGAYRRHLEKALGRIRVCDLSRSIIYAHLSRVRQNSGEAVRKGLIILNMTLDHAALKGFIEHNPARLLKPAMFNASMGKPRERWLPKDELKLLWKALEDASLGGGAVAKGGRGIASSTVLSLSIANALRLILLTGVRRSEAVGMRWDQINGDRWTIPETKNGKSHIVTLHPVALNLLEQQKNLSNDVYVFESMSKSNFPVTGDALTKALERIRFKYMAEVAPFSPHDLRRSVATGCAEYLDAPERLIELLLNHVPKDRLVRTYQVGQQAEKLRKLFLDWGDFIEQAAIGLQEMPSDNIVKVKFGGQQKKD